ncbi:LPS export ABC transporter periplasmic protein LptC [Lawsonia intracellularis]|uniref:LPS export ABC transporter periplasmic protein LptC n=1 Tax=Lawsonia intracellularis TaxID=29546 RepID=UPI000DE475D5|nr:LPS export ABC transporter periplasmic protein LptC [Lawsonia intracellularis]KAA0205368.1 hypothetical protein C4K43_02605 [Lawsonia intracellularis]MBZ3892095.1 LPS export ABC transporter periplasmic protein LptC [Lawsonia intracellularis]RBN33651.1 hypothetical protein DR192_03785 [Lawsonia intracellularis]RBN34251.1 hypothetical protein DR193_03780 [Lawsonia intracellularis]UYH53379.1 LPS export ABC transporter periplasmic protein LptC [Lawsonia intracellularis]
MKKFFIWTIILILIFSFAYWLYTQKVMDSLFTTEKKQAGNELLNINDSDPTSVDHSLSLENSLGLALKGVNLSQGENGIELWRLKASWARLSKDRESIQVDSPIVQYLLGDGLNNDAITVRADKGKIVENQNTIILWENLLIAQDNKSITGPYMVYDTKKRHIYFPSGAQFTSPQATSAAGKVTWDLKSNIISGKNGIKVTIHAKNI